MGYVIFFFVFVVVSFVFVFVGEVVGDFEGENLFDFVVCVGGVCSGSGGVVVVGVSV